MDTFAAVIDAFGGPAKFARAIGLKPSHAGVMKTRRFIPPEHWHRLVSEAEARGIQGITFEGLAKLAAGRRDKRAASVEAAE